MDGRHATGEPMTKVWRAGIATAVFLLVLLAVHWVHVRFLAVDVVLYSALVDGLVACLVGAAVLFGARWFWPLNVFEKFQLCLIWILAAYAFAISVPTVIDRSLSFYILEKLDQRGGGIRLDRFGEVFVDEYMPEHRLVQVRLTEQLASGTILIEDDCVRLTGRGERLAGFSRFYRLHFLPRNRLLMGERSDALTDPFRDGMESPGYEC